MNENYQDVVDDVEDEQEISQEIADEQLEQYATYGKQRDTSDIYTWFWKVVRLLEPLKTVKVANLNKQEIGEHGISVRDALNLGDLGEIFGHKTFGDYWRGKANIISATSMAKKGWFMDLSISQKKVRERQRSPKDERERWRMFGKKKSGGTTTETGE